MSNPTGKGGVKKGDPSRNPTGMTKEARELRDRTNAILLTDERTERWLKAYDGALDDKVPAVVMDYAHRMLGKPPEHVNVSDARGDALLERLRVLSDDQLLEGIHALAVKESKT